MDSNVKALIVKKFKDAEMDLEVGRDLQVTITELTPVSEPLYAVA